MAQKCGVYMNKIHIKFCKIRAQTTNYAVYGELGRYPLAIIAKERATKFWLKILNNPHSLISKMFTDQVNEIQNRSINRNSAKNHWASRMKNFIENLGFPNRWRDQFEHVPPLHILKTRIRDQFVQHWYSQMNNFSKLHYYAQYKSEFRFEKYLQVIENEKFLKT